MTHEKRLKNSVGSKKQGCSNSCKRTCCKVPPPGSVTLTTWNSTNSCDCDSVTLTYTENDNPDNYPGMWEGTVNVSCGAGCSSSSVTVKVWCGLNCACDCDCQEWAMQIDGGTIYRIKNAAAVADHCCCSGFLRSWAFFESVTAGTGNCTGQSFCARLFWEQGCSDLVESAGCISPLSEAMIAVVSGPCGTHEFEITAAGSMDCDSSNDCDQEWTGSGTVQCYDSLGVCQDQTMTLSMCSARFSCPPDGAGDVADWTFDATLDCASNTGNSVGSVSCPDCGNTSFSAGSVAMFTSLLGCTTCDHIDNNFSVSVRDVCYQTDSCPGVNSVVAATLYDDEDCACGSGLLRYYGDEANHCGCSGHWRGDIALECTAGCTSDTVKVEFCTSCNECDQNSPLPTNGDPYYCECDSWSAAIDDGTPVSASECCCFGTGQSRGMLDFGNVTVGAGSGACSGRSLKLRVGWSEDNLLPSDGSASACKIPISSQLECDFTDTCGVTRTANLVGWLDCDQADYFCVWRDDSINFCCDDASETVSVAIELRYKRDFTWEAAVIGAEGTVTATASVTCGTCNPSVGASWTGTWTTDWDTLQESCLSTDNIAFTITEVQSP